MNTHLRFCSIVSLLVSATPLFAQADSGGLEARLARLESQLARIEARVDDAVLRDELAPQIREFAALSRQMDPDRKPDAAIVLANAKATSRFTFGGRFQAQYDGQATAVANGPAPAATGHFFVRRMYLILKANLGGDQLVEITYDFPSNSFDAACLNWRQSDALTFDFGLRKVNFAAEERSSSGALKAIERSAVTRYFVEDNNGRRLGAGSYRIGAFAEGGRGGLLWNLAVTSPERVSSAGSLGTAASNTPAFWGGVGAKRRLGDVTGLLAVNVGFLPDQGGRVTGAGDGLRVLGINSDVTAGGFTLAAEYLASRNERGSAPGRDAASWGFYLQPSYRLDRHWEVVARYSYVDSDGRGITLTDGLRSPASGGTMDKLSEGYFGFTYYVAGHDLKFQAGYVRGESRDTVTGGPARATASGVRSQMQVQF